MSPKSRPPPPSSAARRVDAGGFGPSLRRVAGAAFGASFALAVVAYVEAMALGSAAREPLSRVALVLWGLVAPLGLGIGGAVGAAALFLDPHGPTGPRAFAAHVRAEPVLSRSRTAALAPLLVFGAGAWLAAVAHLARSLLARGQPVAVGAELAFGSLALMVVALSVVLAAVAPLRRALALGASVAPQLVDPILTGGVALVVTAFAFTIGARFGDTGGYGDGVLAIFGVLRRTELDLRPVSHAAAGALGAYFAPVVMRRRTSWGETAALALGALLPLALLAPAAKVLDASPALARVVEKQAPLGRIGLALARRATDRDHDGAASTFGGGDCDDRDPRRNPGALDVPGNGIDEDCSGADTPRAAERVPAAATSAAATRPKLRPDMNLVLVTVDTLRPDVGFMGYDLPTTPNLDRLAAKGVVFDRAYAPASYTGKSVGPILIGKYPSETLRNGNHFNTYDAANTLFAERLAKAGFRTLGAASHWYFLPWSGITQGFAEFDLSAKPSSGQGDTDTSVTSKELTDAALRMLSRAESSDKRFFMWVHYFDPHAQYMEHPGAPSFTRGKTGFMETTRAAYDAEIWFTDKHLGRLLDRIAASPVADRTAIVVTSDHGEAFAEHNMSWHGVEIWEPIVRVPLLVYVPGVTPRRVSGRRSLIDLVPTLLDVLGQPAPPAGELSGESFVGDLYGSEEESRQSRDVYLDMPIGPYNGVRRALVTGPNAGMKVIHFGGAQYGVYDLDKDPGETNDLSGDPTVTDPLVQKLQAFRGRLHEIDVKPADP